MVFNNVYSIVVMTTKFDEETENYPEGSPQREVLNADYISIAPRDNPSEEASESEDSESSDTGKCTLYYNYVEADGSIKQYGFQECDIGTAWGNVTLTQDFPQRSFGYWQFTEWTGKPSSGTITTDYTVWAAYSPIDFNVSLSWDNSAVLTCTWGEKLPGINSMPATVEGKELNSFWLTDSAEKMLLKTHDANGNPLVYAASPLLGGVTLSASDSSTPSATGLFITPIYKEPLLWNTVEDLRNAVGIVPTPFASDPSATIAIAYDDSDDSSDNEVSFSKGFPDSFTRPIIKRGDDDYGEVDDTARVITRQMVNTLGNIGSQEQFFAQCGGYHTFDEAICNAIGGYPEAAILRYFDEDNNCIRTVYSLMDDNYWNFLTNGVDGVHWKYVDDNPSLSLYVDYSNFIDLSSTLFVETGLADLYEVPYDSWLNLFSLSFCYMQSTRHLPDENVPAVYTIEEGVPLYDRLNGGLFTLFTGHVFLDVYNTQTQTTSSIYLHDEQSMSYGASIWNTTLNAGLRYIYKQPQYVSGQGSLFLNKGDKIRVRGVYVDTPAEAYLKQNHDVWDPRTVHEMTLTDKEVRRNYLCRHAMLYKVGWRA